MNDTEYYHAEVDYRLQRLRAHPQPVRRPGRTRGRVRAAAARALTRSSRAKTSR